MLKIGIVGCGRQAATIAAYVGIYNDAYEVTAVVDKNLVNARSIIEEKAVNLSADCRFFSVLSVVIRWRRLP